MNILEINNLNKKYEQFALQDVTLNIPCGVVVGLIGENGAGKSTLIKSILNIVRTDSGSILFNGKDVKLLSTEERQNIAFVLDDIGLPEELDLRSLNFVLSKIFYNWNGICFQSLIEKLDLPKNKVLREFSKGMKMKVAIAVALSYDSKLLILDEPTSGLDPVVRDEILSMLYDYNQEDNRAILISSHITSDLEKLCDYVVYLHKGKVVICEEKDKLKQKLGVYCVEEKQLQELDASAIQKIIRRQYGIDVLAIKEKMPKHFQYKDANLEDILLFYSKGEVW